MKIIGEVKKEDMPEHAQAALSAFEQSLQGGKVFYCMDCDGLRSVGHNCPYLTLEQQEAAYEQSQKDLDEMNKKEGEQK